SKRDWSSDVCSSDLGFYAATMFSGDDSDVQPTTSTVPSIVTEYVTPDNEPTEDQVEPEETEETNTQTESESSDSSPSPTSRPTGSSPTPTNTSPAEPTEIGRAHV